METSAKYFGLAVGP